MLVHNSALGGRHGGKPAAGSAGSFTHISGSPALLPVHLPLHSPAGAAGAGAGAAAAGAAAAAAAVREEDGC